MTDLTGMALSNASLLDEATAAAEAMSMCFSLKNQKRKLFFVDENCHPQNIALVTTRGEALGLKIVVGNAEAADFSNNEYCGAMVQYPNTFGVLQNWQPFIERAHKHEVRNNGQMISVYLSLLDNFLTFFLFCV